MDTMHFTFADTIAGYVTSVDKHNHTFNLKTTDEREFQVRLSGVTFAEVIRNLGEPFQDPGAALEDVLLPGRYLFVHGMFYPEEHGFTFEGKRIIFVGHDVDTYRFEEPDWWIRQIRSLAEFYFHAQFPDGNIDYRNYRTHLTLEGQKIESSRQETDTISRMIYGFATTYLLTGEDRYLEAAEKGTQYLQEHMRSINEGEQIVYWYHAMDVDGETQRKIFASKFGDDYNALPAYEQIYALVGPVQTYRVTGNPRILRDAEMTVNLFHKYFLDREKGGYFSHIHPVTFDPHDEALGNDRARKNWNSIGDHAPAYLINLWLATGEKQYADFLSSIANTIEQHFQDYEHSPFVQERFHEDWSPDTKWEWQQNRAVIGHNLKIAWNLMRIYHYQSDERYKNLAIKIADLMPTVGMDRQRSGWYDIVERIREDGSNWHRFVWHDRKAWWQQEQVILAYLILHGSLREPHYQRLDRESAAFYNAFFLDQDSGGVYFNVLANGFPFLVGSERLKGNHSMSGYHAFELCYLAAIYTNLLITRHPVDLYFKPEIVALKDDLLRVQPDILPGNCARISEVWVNGNAHKDFDPTAMTVTLPRLQEQSERSLNVKVRIIPIDIPFYITLDIAHEAAELTLYGTLDSRAISLLQEQLEKIVVEQPREIILSMEGVRTMEADHARALAFAFDQLPSYRRISVKGANFEVQKILQNAGLWEGLEKLK